MNELLTYIEPETISEENSTVEMKLYAELSGVKQTQEEIDKPADKRLVSTVRKATEESERTFSQTPLLPMRQASQESCRMVHYGFTITDFILLLIACLLFLNIITK